MFPIVRHLTTNAARLLLFGTSGFVPLERYNIVSDSDLKDAAKKLDIAAATAPNASDGKKGRR